jgi:long-subunit acyl-CoA synthetase (AMP-forming)/GNAT superfamily N-acetyltransferase
MTINIPDGQSAVSAHRPDLVSEINAALGAAARESADRSLVSDRGAVATLQASDRVDGLLEHTELELLRMLVQRCVTRLEQADSEARSALRRFAWVVLDLVRRPAVVRRVDRAAIGEWAGLFLRAIEVSHLTVGPLLRQRAARYGEKTLFELPDSGAGESLSWHAVMRRVDAIARGLLSLDDPERIAPVAILSENRIEMALLDLACLSAGLLDVMVPANSTEADVGYILRHAKVATVVVSSRGQLRKVQHNRDNLPALRRVITMDSIAIGDPDLLTLEAVEQRSDQVEPDVPAQRGEAISIDDVATVMYTSGTTGMPKGIQFSHRNLVFKRFARGLALPEIGDGDVFLSYLPLFHTFGRFLEMLGCVFWGAKYCFLQDPSVSALVQGMQRYRPSVFISVPRKWIQLYETAANRANLLEASDEEILEVTKDVTGGRLRWGLSAAGHLESEIFRFFHKQGIQVLSGFGMSEATGGITMTPPFEYKDDSLGVPLPGIELKLAEDGELWIRGPYVMIGYLDPPEGEPSFDAERWLPSGDLMHRDADGHLRIIDRKKEIYKNIKGQTIAPQRIENLFREFESVGRVFLVGDHREYNTLLIYPNPAYKELDFGSRPAQEVRDHFRSLVASVNKFVAPFERIVDFAVIDRDLDGDRGELTPKGTPRRMVVVEHFADAIDALYRRTNLEVGGVELTLPNWLFQALGLTAQDVQVVPNGIAIPSLESQLTVQRLDDMRVRIGSCLYVVPPRALNLGAFLATPRLWLGNEELVAFAPLELSRRDRPGRQHVGIAWSGRVEPSRLAESEHAALREAVRRSEWDLLELDRAARAIASVTEEAALDGVRLLERVLVNEEGPLAEPARLVLAWGAEAEFPDVRRRAFQTLVPAERIARFPETLRRFLARDPLLIDAETSSFLCERSLPDTKIGAFITLVEDACMRDGVRSDCEPLSQSLLGFLAEYGAAHPARFATTRAFLVRMSLFAQSPEVRRRAADARVTLEYGFRQWLGPTSKIAVDTETGQEYRWEDVVVFAEDTAETVRKRLLSAIKTTPFLREAVFLFYRGTLIRLSDIPPGGVWIRLLGSRHGKSVYRVTVQTRTQDTYDLAVNLNDELSSDQVHDEIDWLIVCSAPGPGAPVVERFGGHFGEQDLWSEEYVSGDTLDREIRRLARRTTQEEGLVQLWPFLAWSALSAYVDFWQRTGRRLEITDPSMADIVLPTHDYHTGSRIVSLSARQPHGGLLAMLQLFRERFLHGVEQEHDVLRGVVGWDVIFSAVLEVIGEQDGLMALDEALTAQPEAPAGLREALHAYVATVRTRGFLPMRLFFAAKRYRRWAQLNQDATPQARARTLQELYDTYQLDRLAQSHPEVRLRFFRETVFRGASAELIRGLDELIALVRSGELRNGELAGAVADLRQRLSVESDEDYFLARVPFAHIRPEDEVDFVSTDLGGMAQSEIVVRLEDADANLFQVRHALVPREVERLHRLFLSAKLEVRFRPENRYLLAINAREQIIGGIFYEFEESGESAHLEKIVVADGYRRKGVADGLMREFFNRSRAAGAKRVTTGFFRPEYFYSYGFKIEKRYAGLVKPLAEEPEDATES